MAELKIFFFRYEGYGGTCYVVPAITLEEAKAKLEPILRENYHFEHMTEHQLPFYKKLFEDQLNSGYELEQIVSDVYQSNYLGE